MALDALATPGTILCAALAVLAAVVLIRSRPTDGFIDQKGCGDAGGLPGHDADGCAWKVRVLGVAHRRCTIVVSGTPVHLKRGDLLLALRPQPRGSEPPAATSRAPAQSAFADVPHAS